MPVLLACPTCLQKIRAPDAVIGKQIKCPQCKNPFIASDSAAPPTALARTASARATAPAAPAATVAEALPDDAGEKSWPSTDVEADDAELRPDSALKALPADRGNPFAEFLLLKKMIAPKIQVALFYIGLVGILVMGLVCFVASICLIIAGGLERTLGLLLIVATTLATPLAVVVWRVFCELIATVFRLQDTLPKREPDSAPDK